VRQTGGARGLLDLHVGIEVAFGLEQGSRLRVKGPLGTLEREIHPEISIERADGEIRVVRPSDQPRHRALHGLTRTLINNMVTGVTSGFSKGLEISGVGYRAQVAGKVLKLSLGYSHDIEYPIPVGITIVTPKPTEVVVTGIEKQKVGQTAAEIRDFRGPEPYKGKGVKYANEFIFRKEGKKK